jgi:hypothetical protein
MPEHMSMPLDEFATLILADGVIDADEVAKIRDRLYEDGIIDREEAEFLFKLNDAVSGKENDPSWQAFFVEALSDHVLKDEETPGVIDADEATFLIDRIKGDEKIDETELQLLINVCDTATGESPGAFIEFVLDSVKAAVIADGVVDSDEVDTIKKVIYGSGGSGGADVDRAEADFLFDINDATTDNTGHDPSWQLLFVEAIAKHVLEDEASPGEIDEDEGDWLIGRIEGDGEYDTNEKALLAHIKANATSIAGKLKFKIDMFAD